MRYIVRDISTEIWHIFYFRFFSRKLLKQRVFKGLILLFGTIPKLVFSPPITTIEEHLPFKIKYLQLIYFSSSYYCYSFFEETSCTPHFSCTLHFYISCCAYSVNRNKIKDLTGCTACKYSHCYHGNHNEAVDTVFVKWWQFNTIR